MQMVNTGWLGRGKVSKAKKQMQPHKHRSLARASITSKDNVICDLQQVAGSTEDREMEMQQRWQELLGRFPAQSPVAVLTADE